MTQNNPHPDAATPAIEIPSRHQIAEIISIGDEMTSGARLDTNAQWISRRVGELGITVEFHSTVGDTLQHNIDVFRIATERADVVICTGGLGPTRDDLTRQALAEMAGVELELDEASLRHIADLFARRNREMPERNRVQAMFPAGSQEIFNPQGTAPGVDMVVKRDDGTSSRVFALPGVPAEMKRMFDDTVAPRILSDGGKRRHIEHCVMKFFGTGESDMERRLGDMIARDRQPRVGITVSSATISLRITAMGENREQCLDTIETTRKEIIEKVGEYYFGEGESFEQYHAIDEQLRGRGESLITVELGRAAPLADWFASLGPSPAYRGGLALGDESDLERFLGEGHDLNALRSRSSADWLLLVDAYPSLKSDSDDRPLPAAEVSFTVLHPNGNPYRVKTEMGGHPSIIQARIGKAALAWLRKVIGETET